MGDLLDDVGAPVDTRLVVLADAGGAEPLCDQSGDGVLCCEVPKDFVKCRPGGTGGLGGERGVDVLEDNGLLMLLDRDT